MPDQDHVDKLNEGVEAWNAWRSAKPEVVPDLSGFDFRGKDVAGADFTRANMADANLSGIKFGDADVTDADFRSANLRGAKLEKVVGLLPDRLAGADLTRAKLPPELDEFPGLEHVAEVSRHARVNFLAVVAGCVFCWLTIAQTTDGALIANRGVMPLPVINTKVPTTGFFLFAPAILLALYVYLQLYLQRMWDGLSGLPAIFPDGARLDQKAFPWLLSGLISLYLPKLRKGAPPFTLPQVILSLVAAWLLVPATIGWFWWRYLLVTDEIGLAPHVVLLALAIAFGVLFYGRAQATLRGHVPLAWLADRLPARKKTAPLMILVASFGATGTATYGFRQSTEIWPLEFSGEEIRTKAEVEKLLEKTPQAKKNGAAKEKDENTKDTETAKTESLNFDELQPLSLKRAHLRHAKGKKAFLVGVDLQGADLSSVDFQDADLRGAKFQGATLDGAKFGRAKLRGAIFGEMKLVDVDLDGADVDEAAFAQACGVGTSVHAFVKRCEPTSGTAPPGKQALPPKSPDKPTDKPADKQVAVGAFGKRPGEIFDDCKGKKDDDKNFICPQMVVVPAGGFTMGSPENEEGRSAREGPQHPVKFAKPFAIGVHEVTFAQWDACVAAGECNKYRPDDEGWGRGNRPVVNVSWDDAQTYIVWLNTKVDGTPYSLPSEAQWEYVARAGSTTRYWFGDDDSDLCLHGNAADQSTDYGWRNETCDDGFGAQTAPVGKFKANAFGVYDTIGNVWEWVEDCWHDNYKGAPDNGDVWEEKDAKDCSVRVLRGGSWDGKPRFVRSADRFRGVTSVRDYYIGFRVSRTLSR